MLFLMSDITVWFWGVCRGVSAWICSFIYELIAWVYELLFTVARVRLLNNGVCKSADGLTYITDPNTGFGLTKEQCMSAIAAGSNYVYTDSPITLIYHRITLLLAIVMVFYVTFQFIKYLVTPEEIADKEKGVEKLGFRLFTVVALLALVPNIFDWAYDLQEKILDSHFLAKIVLGVQSVDDRNFGRNFSADLLETFYYFDPAFASQYSNYENPYDYESSESCDDMPCNILTYTTIRRLRQLGTLDFLTYGLANYERITDNVPIFYIHFEALLALVCGVLILWMLIMYSLDVGLRVIHLTFLQIIAPIPIISYLSPKKDGTFQRWTKQCLNSFLDLFIRLAVIYFVMLLIQSMTRLYDAGILLNLPSDETTKKLELYVYLILILALMRFGLKLPKLLENLFPGMGTSLGDLGLKPGERIPTAAKRIFGAAVGGATGAVVGLATGIPQGLRKIRSSDNKKVLHGITGGTWGATRGTVGGLLRGVTVGAKKGNVIKNAYTAGQKQYQSNKKFGDKEEAGYNIFKQVKDKGGEVIGIGNRADGLEKRKTPKEQLMGEYDSEVKYRKAISDKSFEKALKKSDKVNDNVKEALRKYNDWDTQETKLTTSETREKLKMEKIAQFKEKYKDRGYTDKQYNDMAENELLEELSKVRNEKKQAKDEVAFAYEDWAKQKTDDGQYNDQEIANMEHARIEENKLYNKYANNDNQFSRESSIYKVAKEKLSSIIRKAAKDISDEEVKEAFGNGKISRAAVEDDWIKNVVNNRIVETQDDIRNIKAELEHVKSETSSGGGKK